MRLVKKKKFNYFNSSWRREVFCFFEWQTTNDPLATCLARFAHWNPKCRLRPLRTAVVFLHASPTENGNKSNGRLYYYRTCIHITECPYLIVSSGGVLYGVFNRTLGISSLSGFLRWSQQNRWKNCSSSSSVLGENPSGSLCICLRNEHVD